MTDGHPDIELIQQLMREIRERWSKRTDLPKGPTWLPSAVGKAIEDGAEQRLSDPYGDKHMSDEFALFSAYPTDMDTNRLSDWLPLESQMTVPASSLNGTQVIVTHIAIRRNGHIFHTVSPRPSGPAVLNEGDAIKITAWPEGIHLT